ncbi:MAG: hypothetical protein N2508_07090 [Anaerolineae bacterium]|nr:hypothetical protein [Anaerolineae bacterium]
MLSKRVLGHCGAIFLVGMLSFALNHLPYILSGRPDAIGDNGDSGFHLACQMVLDNPTLFPKDIELHGIICPSRLPSDLVIYRVVVGVTRLAFGGDLFAANAVLFWIIHVCFIVGYYCIGLAVLRTPARAMVFSALYVIPAPAIHAWTGMGYGSVIPHALGVALLPWCIWGYLRWSERGCKPRPLYLLFFLIGLSVNLYPQHPIYAFLTIGLTILLRREAKLSHLLLAGLAFSLGSAPTLVSSALRTWSRLSSLLPAERAIADALFDRHYSFLINPSVFLRGVVRLRLWFYILVGGLIYLYKRSVLGLASPEQRAIILTLCSAGVVLVGGAASMVYRPLVSLLFTRASALLYLGPYLACAWLAAHLARRRSPITTALALGLIGLFAINGLWHTPLANALRDRRSPQSRPDYYALSAWAAQNTAPDSLFMVPMRPSDSYYAFRVYSGRSVTMQWGTGDMVMSNPKGAVMYYWPRYLDIFPLYTEGGSTADFVRVAHKYDVDYIVTDPATPRPPDLPIAYRNATYTVFIVPPEE